MSQPSQQLHVVVIVLGDLGRSPRMQYHALSLLQSGHIVSLIGYTGEDLIPDLLSYVVHESETDCRLMSDDLLNKSEQQPEDSPQGTLNVVRFAVPSPSFLRRIRCVYFLWRILSLGIWLTWVLFVQIQYKIKAPHCVLVQNPPALPLLLVTRVYCWIIGMFVCRGRKGPGLIIDWHNLGYSMLTDGALRGVAKVYEKVMAPLADAHLTVTNAMKQFLETELKIPLEKVRVLPDCPPHMFQARSVAEQHTILQKLHPRLEKACPKSWPEYDGNQGKQTLLTAYRDGKYQPRLGRPALITSSTSWTPDEDFGILLNALLLLDAKIENEGTNLRVMVVVTGKGPEKAQYEVQISKLTLHHVAVTTMWLEPGDYPVFLACADVGVSLHTSTSGLDLPMKVIDLFGCEVPVCAMDFDCLSELVEDDVNGHVFTNSSQLADQLFELLEPLHHDQHVPCHSFGKLDQYSQQLQNGLRWHENWCLHALPMIEEVANTSDPTTSK